MFFFKLLLRLMNLHKFYALNTAHTHNIRVHSGRKVHGHFQAKAILFHLTMNKLLEHSDARDSKF